MLRVIAADTAAAILNDKYEAGPLLATAAVLAEFPYKEPKAYKVIFGPFEQDSCSLLREMELALSLAEEVKTDEIHIDSTLGGVNAKDLTKELLDALPVSSRAKEILAPIVDQIKELGIKAEKLGVPMLMLGKESLVVRIAELTAGAAAVWLATSLALEHKFLLVGLPKRCSLAVYDGDELLTREGVTALEPGTYRFVLRSLNPAEEDVIGFFDAEVKGSVEIIEFPNPKALRFRALKISAKG